MSKFFSNSKLKYLSYIFHLKFLGLIQNASCQDWSDITIRLQQLLLTSSPDQTTFSSFCDKVSELYNPNNQNPPFRKAMFWLSYWFIECLSQENCLPDIHGFMPGMKLEAVHPKDPSSICVATVSHLVNEHYFLVEIDSLICHRDNDKAVMCCHSASRNIFPVGWCDLFGIQLTPPPGDDCFLKNSKRN